MNRIAHCPGRISILIAFAAAGCESPTDMEQRAPSEPPRYVGSDTCARCHVPETSAWAGSHHDRAMEPATPETVLGDFSNASFSDGVVTSTFRRERDAFVVNTEGSDGELMDYTVAYTFGVEPLQQYLLEMPNGKLQALNIAWDTRRAEQGGQRWFHLQPGAHLAPDDPLHWTGVLQNWNAACAECHSTNVEKNYDPDLDTYATTYSSVDVGCESCHGPGSDHVDAPGQARMQLGSADRAWAFIDNAPIASRVPPARSDVETQTCAACHARRGRLSEGFEPGDAFLDAFRPALLLDPLYHADGQIRDEVFVYGSFLQSKMHAAGVTCTDCHDVHSTRLRAEGNAVCSQCHLPSAFDTPEHHRHAEGAPGAQCVSCHMRDETYMIVDPRRDHSFRVPRPDLSASLGTPNACNDCHDEPADWAADQVAAWRGESRSGEALPGEAQVGETGGGEFHYAEALYAGRYWTAERGSLLNRVAADPEMPGIVRATALTLLAEQVDAAAVDTLRAALASDEPLVVLGALDALAAVPVELRADLGQRFLTDAPLAHRLAAAEALLPVRAALSVRRQADLDGAIEALRSSQRLSMDWPEGLLNRANLELGLGVSDAAEQTLRIGIERHPFHAALYANLGDLYRRLGREADAEAVLREGLAAAPGDAALTHALGLALVRGDRAAEALNELRRATELDRDNPRYAYVYGVALHSLGSAPEALELLAGAYERFPGYSPTLLALATMHRDAGDRDAALRYARLLLELSPADMSARALVEELQ